MAAIDANLLDALNAFVEQQQQSMPTEQVYANLFDQNHALLSPTGDASLATHSAAMSYSPAYVTSPGYSHSPIASTSASPIRPSLYQQGSGSTSSSSSIQTTSSTSSTPSVASSASSVCSADTGMTSPYYSSRQTSPVKSPYAYPSTHSSYFGTMQEQYLGTSAQDSLSQMPRSIQRKASLPSSAFVMPSPPTYQPQIARRASAASLASPLPPRKRVTPRPSMLNIQSNHVAVAPASQQEASALARHYTQPLPVAAPAIYRSSTYAPSMTSPMPSPAATIPYYSPPASSMMNINGVSLNMEDLAILDSISPVHSPMEYPQNHVPVASPISMPMSAPAWQTNFDHQLAHYEQQQQLMNQHLARQPEVQPQMPQNYTVQQSNYTHRPYFAPECPPPQLSNPFAAYAAPSYPANMIGESSGLNRSHSAPIPPLMDPAAQYAVMSEANLPRTRRGSSIDSTIVQSLPAAPAPDAGRKIKAKPARRSPSRKNSSSNVSQFVNFTSADSHKLLTGVAPSGSSKRKREQESAEAAKRRVVTV